MGPGAGLTRSGIPACFLQLRDVSKRPAAVDPAFALRFSKTRALKTNRQVADTLAK
jgi:hypothetical protein